MFALPPEWRSLSDRNTVRNHTGMVFGFRPESRSPSTGFPSSSHSPQTAYCLQFCFFFAPTFLPWPQFQFGAVGEVL